MPWDKAYQPLGNCSQAIAYHTQRLAKEVGDRAGEGTASNNLGNALEENSDLPAVCRCLSSSKRPTSCCSV